MQQSNVLTLFLATLVLGQAAIHNVDKHASLSAQPINPPLKDSTGGGAVPTKFFPTDYAEDKRPVPQKKILDMVKGPGQPYPALQAKSDFDRDFVKDENADKGHWKAQFEYDTLRNKIAKEEADEKAAQSGADKEGADVDAAQKKADAAAKKAKDAQDGVDTANKGDLAGDKAGEGGDKAGGASAPSQAELEKLQKKVAEAEANYEKEKKDFEECKRQLEEAKKNVADLKAAQAEMEQKLSGETKLWMESKTAHDNLRLNLHNAKQEAYVAKREAAVARLNVAQNAKMDLDKVLAKEKLESDQAHQNLATQHAEVEQAKKDLEQATVRLQKLKGYTPANSMKSEAGVGMKALTWLESWR